MLVKCNLCYCSMMDWKGFIRLVYNSLWLIVFEILVFSVSLLETVLILTKHFLGFFRVDIEIIGW